MISPGRLLDATIAVLGADTLDSVQLHEAARLLAGSAWPAGMPRPGEHQVRSWRETQGLGPYTPPLEPYPLLPTQPALLWWRDPPDLAALAALLSLRYPSAHPLRLLSFDEAGATIADRALSLAELADAASPQAASCVLHLPALAPAADLRGPDGLRWVVARLLGPGGCPWDVRQTHQSLRGALLEEAHEALEALDAGDMAGLSEELGDLLIAIFAHSEMARQGGGFNLELVFEQVTAKLIRRHPHVFGELTVSGEGEVLGNWEQIKARELAAKGRSRPSALDGVPAGLPALAAAQKVGTKAARAGFNWGDLAGVWAKLDEELAELRAAAGTPAAAEELGDILFVLTRLADWLGLDAEAALREAMAKFRRRFTTMEGLVAERGIDMRALDISALLALWGEAKALA